MRVGDLVRDTHDGDLGVITEVCCHPASPKPFFVVFFNGDTVLDGWYDDFEVELVCK